MHGIVTLKYPPDFMTLGRNSVLIGPTAQRSWRYLDRRQITDRAITNCLMYLSERYYSASLRERFADAASEAIPFVVHHSHPEQPIQISLTRFTKQGERVVTLIVDGMPLPGDDIELPSPTDPDLTTPNWRHLFAHAYILPRVDAYVLVAAAPILQLNLAWSEHIN